MGTSRCSSSGEAWFKRCLKNETNHITLGSQAPNGCAASHVCLLLGEHALTASTHTHKKKRSMGEG